MAGPAWKRKPVLNPPDNDNLSGWISFVSWLGGIALAIGTGLVTGTWSVSVKTANFENRLKALEEDRKERLSFCEHQQTKLMGDLRKEIISIVKDFNTEAAAHNAKNIAEIHTSVAVLTERQEHMQRGVENVTKMVTDIVGIMDKRSRQR